MLYIPYGWWHQIESSGASTSVTFRWNPFETFLRKAAIFLSGLRTKQLPQSIIRMMYAAVLSGEYKFSEEALQPHGSAGAAPESKESGACKGDDDDERIEGDTVDGIATGREQEISTLKVAGREGAVRCIYGDTKRLPEHIIDLHLWRFDLSLSSFLHR